MKPFVTAVAIAALAITTFAADASAQSRRHHRGGGSTIITQPAIDPLTAMLLLGGGAGVGASPLAALALTGVLSQGTVVETRRFRRR